MQQDRSVLAKQLSAVSAVDGHLAFFRKFCDVMAPQGALRKQLSHLGNVYLDVDEATKDVEAGTLGNVYVEIRRGRQQATCKNPRLSYRFHHDRGLTSRGRFRRC